VKKANINPQINKPKNATQLTIKARNTKQEVVAQQTPTTTQKPKKPNK
jgi:hypothetical protein